MMAVRGYAVGLLLVTPLMACSTGNAGKKGCQSNGDCPAGHVCQSSQCVALCTNDTQCASTQVCTSSVCVTGSRQQPQIVAVDGDNPDTVCPDANGTHCITTGILISGKNLGGISVALANSAGIKYPDLTIRPGATDESAAVDLPADIKPGDWVLTVTNQAGSATQGLTLLQGPAGPDMTADQMVDTINANASAGKQFDVRLIPSHTHDAADIVSGTIDVARLPVGTTAGTVAAGNQTPFDAKNDASSTPASCQAILSAGQSQGDGIYWIKPLGAQPAFRAYCDMTTMAGGWTQVLNINPADGSIVSFTNTRFWRDATEYGQIEDHFTNDYKSPADWELPASQILIEIAKPGNYGQIIGYRGWDLVNAAAFNTAFATDTQTTLTNNVLTGSDVANVDPYEPLIYQDGKQLVANWDGNNFGTLNHDRARLSLNGYPAQSDDNEPGLGTEMNSNQPNVCVPPAANCYRYWDVELWVNSSTNIWGNSASAAGTYKWIGTDGGCGPSCTAGAQAVVARFSPYWTYRIYVR